MLRYQMPTQNPACNDNGSFAALRRPAGTPRGILSVASSMAGPISLTQVSDGVLIIARGRDGAPAGARRSAH